MLWLNHGACSIYNCMYINAAENCDMSQLYLRYGFYNIILKIKQIMYSLIWMEASRCAYERTIILNSVRQHNYCITQGNYIGYMFRL